MRHHGSAAVLHLHSHAGQITGGMRHRHRLVPDDHRGTRMAVGAAACVGGLAHTRCSPSSLRLDGVPLTLTRAEALARSSPTPVRLVQHSRVVTSTVTRILPWRLYLCGNWKTWSIGST